METVAEGNNATLKEAIISTLNTILNSTISAQERSAAEQQIKSLEVIEGFGLHLTELVVDPQQSSTSVRQLSSVLLKQYVEAHWSDESDKFSAPETAESTKAVIRELLPHGLRDPESKVRSTVAYAIGAIAHWDWPEKWPQLFDILMHALNSGDSNIVHGAMRVLTEFSREVTDTQMPRVAPVIFPEMYKIFTQPQMYSIRTRSRAIEIFTTCAHMIGMMGEFDKKVIKKLMLPVLAQFTEALIQGLQVEDGPASDAGLKKEIMQALTQLLQSFPKHITPYLQQILNPVWTTLTQSADFYVRTVVNNEQHIEEVVDEDGEILSFESFIYTIFGFVEALIDGNKLRSSVKKCVGQLCYYIIWYMQITEDQTEQWSEDPDKFVEDEDDESLSYSVRIAAQDLLLNLGSQFEDGTATGLCEAITQHMQECEQHKSSGNPHWWKIHEASMLALGSVRDLISEQIKGNKLNFDVSSFLSNIALVDLNQNVSPFLLGRALWIGSRLTSLITPEIVSKFLLATERALHSTQPASVRVSACRAVYELCNHLSAAGQEHLLSPHLAGMLDGLISLATQYSTDVLSLALEAIRNLLSVNSEFTALAEGKVGPLALAVFLKYSSDPVICSVSEDLFQQLLSNEVSRAPTELRLLPTICSILQEAEDKVAAGLPSLTLELLTIVVKTGKQPLSQALIEKAFPAAVHCTLNTDDTSVIQSGGECMRAYVSVACDQVCTWQDDAGVSGLSYILRVVTLILSPSHSEYTAAFAGKLISSLVGRAADRLGPDATNQILRSVLSKLQQAETIAVVQSLVVVFAYLMNQQLEAVLDFLVTLPGPTGNSALEFVLVEWCAKQTLFYGTYETRLCTLALCKLLQHAVSTDDNRLQRISVKDEFIQTECAAAGVTTRSSKKRNVEEEWTSVPVLVKIYKLILHEFQNEVERKLAKQSRECDSDSDEDDEGVEDDDDWEDIPDDTTGGAVHSASGTISSIKEQVQDTIFKALSAGLDYDAFDLGDVFEDEIEEEDDIDVLNDPVYQMDMGSYLTEFFTTFTSQPYHNSYFAPHLSKAETQLLTTYVTAAATANTNK